jgi:MFS family permease
LVTRTYKEHRGLLTGLTIMGASLGSIIAAPLITMLIESFNWRTAYLCLGMVILVVVATSAVFLRDPAKEASSTFKGDSLVPEKISEQRGNILLKAIRSRPFWLLGIILFCVGFAQSEIMVHLIPYSTDKGVSAIVSASIISVFQGACAMGNFSVGRSNDIIGGRSSMVICLISLTLSYVILLIANTAWFFYIAAILAGMGFGGAVTLRSTIVAELFGLHSHGEITGAIMFISTIGSAVGPIIAGYVFDVTNQYLWAFITTISVCIIGLIMAGLLKSRFATLNRKMLIS